MMRRASARTLEKMEGIAEEQEGVDDSSRSLLHSSMATLNSAATEAVRNEFVPHMAPPKEELVVDEDHLEFAEDTDERYESEEQTAIFTLPPSMLEATNNTPDYGYNTHPDYGYNVHHHHHDDDDDDDEDRPLSSIGGPTSSVNSSDMGVGVLNPLYETGDYNNNDDEEEVRRRVSAIYDYESVESSIQDSAASEGRRRSFAALRRSSSEALSLASAPPNYSDSSPSLFHADENLRGSMVRRVTVAGPTGGGGGGGEDDMNSSHHSTQRTRRRTRLVIRQSSTELEDNHNASDHTSTTGSGGGGSARGSTLMSSIRYPFASGNVRRSIRRPSQSVPHTSSFTSGRAARSQGGSVSSNLTNTTTTRGNIDIAVAADRLGSSDMNSEWENVAAAAAVVAASVQAPGKRGISQFSQGDHVVVMLTLLNITSREADKDSFTVAPVNQYGYPAGEGPTEATRHGPFSYVLGTVIQVHFDEDERYYTVRREDTGAEQRADPGWMEPLKDLQAVEVARLAAARTNKSLAEKMGQPAPRKQVRFQLWLAWPLRYVRNTVIPSYYDAKLSAKTFVRNLLHGSPGFSCRLRVTYINFCVLCSFIYLFIEVISLAFLPAKWDQAVAITAMSAWSVLVLELLLELLIRPRNYGHLSRTDRAYSPSTARHLNTFHLVCEVLALLTFIPQIQCAFGEKCGRQSYLNGIQSGVIAVTGENNWYAAAARFAMGLTFLRTFGLVRHWKQMWINNMFERGRTEDLLIHRLLMEQEGKSFFPRFLSRKHLKVDDTDATIGEEDDDGQPIQSVSDEDQQLKNAATIGTALMLVNSHRALAILLLIVTFFPAMYSMGQQNPSASRQVSLLQDNNLIANSEELCDYLQTAVSSWLSAATYVHTNYRFYDDEYSDVFLLYARLLPVRCPWQRDDGVITYCLNKTSEYVSQTACSLWGESWLEAETSFLEGVARTDEEFYADWLGLRAGAMSVFSLQDEEVLGSNAPQVFSVTAVFNETTTVAHANLALFLLLISTLALGLIGLTVMRGDAARLVLHPLQRMLKIVVRYAENPLAKPSSGGGSGKDNDDEDANNQLGKYETEQLINAIAKIADLLRKCWGVAGAGIISTNLARTKDGKTVVFNPTVPGKRVYALFGFVAINDFSKQLRDLDKDVMILINDVAKVVHDEVYRWALGDSGQCNKNLGSAFLMVFRIGDFSEVHDKKKRATDVVFNTAMSKKNSKARQRKNAARRMSSRQFELGTDGTLQLASLPGIQAFADRALLGCLKSFAGIHRDKDLNNWKKDFRLGAGVGMFNVNIIYGMDAGWAVEGAVGSEYKIDATYLSPHVNMASRMMSATKQYGVTVLVSQAVEELLSKPARNKMRHLDTVYVKGSRVPQRIYTYDARFEGVDFFLFERTPDQADMEAEAYNPGIWDRDQDLKSMRQHVSDDFMEKFLKGIDEYIDGRWKKAIKTLQEADDLMLETVMEEGYVDYKCDVNSTSLFDRESTNEEIRRIRQEFGDGASKCLVQYMQRRKGIPPKDWIGVRHLTSK